MATIRNKRSIAIGNLIGSSTLNLTLILGTSLLFGRQYVPVGGQLLFVNLPIMVGVSLLCLPIFLSGRRISRLEGGLMIGGYALYMGYLIFWAVTKI
jgi:cation:H+ antiporter